MMGAERPASGRWRRRSILKVASLPLALTASPALVRPTGAGALGEETTALSSFESYIGFIDVPRFFPETEHNVTGEFFRYFYEFGGVDTFGYPLTEEFWVPSDDQGTTAGRMLQYFQRARLEYDINDGAVRRSALGERLIAKQPAVPPVPGARYYPETGHNVGHGFLAFFDEAGGEAVLGYPLSEEVWEYGHTVQWLQNARLEWWPEAESPRKTQLGLIGEEHLRQVASGVPPEALRPAEPLPPVREWLLPQPLAPHKQLEEPLAVPILYYHHVPSQDALRRHIRAFKDAGRAIVPLSRAVAAIRGLDGLPDRPLVLTFDDGWESQYHNAAPVLQAEDVPGTFFVITRYLGEFPGYMSWDQVRVLKELGNEVECHTQNHPNLDDLHREDEGAVLAEVWESLAILERRLGPSQRLFAYPNGRWSEGVASLVARVYQGAVATGGGYFQHPDQLFWLSRIKAEPSYKPEALIRQFGG
ncbi:MAG TPA: polysaccharide deacetylase family protein [Chloroflexota bacterium]|nr:polysaccharide deacetylase family protein [Chloroflexota bacterium]